jgi:hypothetical protein
MSQRCRASWALALLERTSVLPRTPVIAAAGGALLLIVFALIGLQPRAARADVVGCDGDVATHYQIAFSTTPIPGYYVTGVYVSGISDGCIGGKLVVQLNNGDTPVGSALTTVDASEMLVKIPARPAATDVTKVVVQLTIDPLRTPTPEGDGEGHDVVPSPAPVASPPPETSPEPYVEESTGPEGFLDDLATPVPAAVTPVVTSTPEQGTPTPVIVAQVPPVTPTPSPPAPTATPSPAPTQRPSYQPALLDNILGLNDIATSPSAILSNAGLSAGLLALMLIDTTIFNAILKENSFLIHGFVQRRLRWLRALLRRPHPHLPHAHLPHTPQSSSTILKPMIVLSLSALIYSLLDPNFGLNNSSLVLFLSLFFGLAVATYVNDGGQVLVAERRFGIPFSLQFFPAAIGIAIVSIFVSRLVDIHPGIIFGFVAGAREASREEPDDRQDGIINFLPMASLLIVSVLAWLAIGPVDSIAGGDTLVGTVVEASCAMLFVGSIQGLLFTLIPLQFMDGQKVWKWNKLAWLCLALPVGFLFFHTVLNQGATLASASSSHGVIALYTSAIVAWILTIVAWIYFRKVNPNGATMAEEEIEDATT